ncbi:MAG: hypothetical protein Q9207_007785 [Kuettlingeria erythrocarpa]
MDPKGPHSADVPPYEPNPAYTQQPTMQHHEYVPSRTHFTSLSIKANTSSPSSYNTGAPNNAPIQQYPQQPMASPPMDQPKQEFYPGQPGTPQHQASMPMQQQQQQQQPMPQSGYQTATPLANLGEGAAPVDCPCCHMRALTRPEYHSGNTTK